MKKSFAALLLAFLFISLTQCCKKDDVEINNVKEISVDLDDTKSYQMEIGDIPVSQEAIITTQASNASSSELATEALTGRTFYNYVPVTGYEGTDEVTIEVTDKYNKTNYSCGTGDPKKIACGNEKKKSKCGQSKCGGSKKSKCGGGEKKKKDNLFTYHIKFKINKTK